MRLEKPFNTLSFKEYTECIDNYRLYENFNTLGLYRSILENKLLSLEEKIFIRDYAHKKFKKRFDFLQLKDPNTFLKLCYLGQNLSKGDEINVWNNIRKNQQQILANKKIKHRNFGVHSKHDCGQEHCVWKGIMIKQGSWLAENAIHFAGDKNRYQLKQQSKKRKSERKNIREIIRIKIDE